MVLWISGSRVDYSINDAGIIDSPYGGKHKILLPPPKKNWDGLYNKYGKWNYKIFRSKHGEMSSLHLGKEKYLK